VSLRFACDIERGVQSGVLNCCSSGDYQAWQRASVSVPPRMAPAAEAIANLGVLFDWQGRRSTLRILEEALDVAGERLLSRSMEPRTHLRTFRPRM